MKNRYRKFLFWFIKRSLKKHFACGLTGVFGLGPEKDKIIAWEWRFYEDEYEKRMEEKRNRVLSVIRANKNENRKRLFNRAHFR